jgi:hypothetical protein
MDRTRGLYRKGRWAIIINHQGNRHAMLGDEYVAHRYEPPFDQLQTDDDSNEHELGCRFGDNDA